MVGLSGDPPLARPCAAVCDIVPISRPHLQTHHLPILFLDFRLEGRAARQALLGTVSISAEENLN